MSTITLLLVKPATTAREPLTQRPSGSLRISMTRAPSFSSSSASVGVGLFVELPLNVGIEGVGLAGQAVQAGLVDAEGIRIVGRQDDMGFGGVGTAERLGDEALQGGFVRRGDPAGAERPEQGRGSAGLPDGTHVSAPAAQTRLRGRRRN
jgi:hypothetical protein